MAQVSMDAREYNELVRKAEAYDELIKQLGDNLEVSFDNSTKWRPVGITLHTTFGEHLNRHLVRIAATQLAKISEAMDYLVGENEYIFDMEKTYITDPNWDERLRKNQYDMRYECKSFKDAWNAATKRAEDRANEPATEELEIEDAKEEK